MDVANPAVVGNKALDIPSAIPRALPIPKTFNTSNIEIIPVTVPSKPSSGSIPVNVCIGIRLCFKSVDISLTSPSLILSAYHDEWSCLSCHCSTILLI